MQIRTRGSSIEFLGSEYDPRKKRSTQKMIGAMPSSPYTLLTSLKEKMTEEEVPRPRNTL